MAAFETVRPARGLVGGRLPNIIAVAIAAIADWNDARVTRNALSKLSDRELEDIGLCRADIEQIATRGL